MITIIGAGPVGCHAAALLAKKGRQVRVFEEHGSIGRPVQCTGIVTKSISEVLRLRNEFIVNRLRYARLHAPDGGSVDIKTRDVVIDRARFDNHIAEQAKKNGAEILLNSRVTGIRRSSDGKSKGRKIKIRIADKNRRKIRVDETDILVGADGPKSLVSRFIGNKMPEFWVGVQAVVKMPVDARTYSVYFGDDIPGFFGWVVPENESRARVGIATTRNPNTVFKRFIKRFGKCKIMEMQGGLIPRYDPRTRLYDDDIYVVGDAATQVKATTGGGLVPGMKAAECMTRTIFGNKSYARELAGVSRELATSLLLRKMLDRFDEHDYNRLIEICGSEKMKNVLDKDDRDRPSKIVFKSLIKEPKLLLFMKTLFRAKRVENA